MPNRIPRSLTDDYTLEMAEARRQYLKEKTGKELEHTARYSFDPSILPGNIEHFIGVAQVPIGVAGPLLVNGEHARGEFYIPLATTEGTLVGTSFCVTGVLTEKREVVHEKLRACGAEIHDSVKKNTTYLVAGDKTGKSKLDQAKKFGTKVVTEAEMNELIEKGPLGGA